MPDTDRLQSPAVQGVPFADFIRWLRALIVSRPQRRMNEERVPVPEAIATAIRKVDHIGTLRPGWNGHGAAVAVPEVRAAAARFLRLLVLRHGAMVPPPTLVAPTSDGGVAFEWRMNQSALALEVVFLRESIEWTLREKDRELRGSDEASMDEILEAFKDVVPGHTTVTPL